DVAAALNLMTGLLHDKSYGMADQLKKRIDELEKQAARLEIAVHPADAAIAVDGTALAQSGKAALYVNPGIRKVKASLEGIHRDKTITVAAGDRKTVQIDLTEVIDSESDDAAGRRPSASVGVSPITPDSMQVDKASDELPRAFWAASAIAGIGLVSGTVFGTMALRDEKDFDESPRQGTMDSGRRAAIIADISFGIALGAAIAGTVVLVSEKKKKQKAHQRTQQQKAAGIMIHPVVSHLGAGFWADLTF
ncbi:MAG: hypothetical protein JXX14_03270, partial [Deltaproteobacteria bacterium]|nr:hypothetical protein [Deltaproteobacteria bacterium]